MSKSARVWKHILRILAWAIAAVGIVLLVLGIMQVESLQSDMPTEMMIGIILLMVACVPAMVAHRLYKRIRGYFRPTASGAVRALDAVADVVTVIVGWYAYFFYYACLIPYALVMTFLKGAPFALTKVSELLAASAVQVSNAESEDGRNLGGGKVELVGCRYILTTSDGTKTQLYEYDSAGKTAKDYDGNRYSFS